MPPLKYVLLALSIAGIIVGLAAPADLRSLDFALPIGAALLGMFLIVRALSGETARHDTENHSGH